MHYSEHLGKSKKCPKGKVRDRVTKRCRNSKSKCPKGKVRDRVTKRCRNSKVKKCPAGKVRDRVTKRCRNKSKPMKLKPVAPVPLVKKGISKKQMVVGFYLEDPMGDRRTPTPGEIQKLKQDLLDPFMKYHQTNAIDRNNVKHQLKWDVDYQFGMSAVDNSRILRINYEIIDDEADHIRNDINDLDSEGNYLLDDNGEYGEDAIWGWRARIYEN